MILKKGFSLMVETLETRIVNPRSSLEKKIYELGPWFHNIHLPDGTQTAPNHPLGDFPAFKWKPIQRYLPEDLTGWRVLDIGCNAGFYSLELAKRGAEVTGIDIDDHYLRQAKWITHQFGLTNKISLKNMQVYDLAFSKKTYDLVLFMGVFYHLRYPLLALDIVSRKFTNMMIFQTLTVPGKDVIKTPKDMRIEDRELMLQQGWPIMAFIENSLAGDDTNWWAPNHACVEAMLRSCNLKVKNYPDHEIYICEHSRKKTNDTSVNKDFKNIVKMLGIS